MCIVVSFLAHRAHNIHQPAHAKSHRRDEEDDRTDNGNPYDGVFKNEVFATDTACQHYPSKQRELKDC